MALTDKERKALRDGLADQDGTLTQKLTAAVEKSDNDTSVEAQVDQNTADITQLQIDLGQAETDIDALEAGKLSVSTFTVGFAALNTAGSGVAALFGTAIPDNAIVKRTYYEVTQTFAGDVDDASTLSIGLEDQVEDVVATVAISDVSNPWGAGLQEGIQDGAMANALKLTTARQLAVEWTAAGSDTALTAGAMTVFVEWVQGS